MRLRFVIAFADKNVKIRKKMTVGFEKISID